MSGAKKAMDQLLAESLKELAGRKPIEKITIKEITDCAGVIRPTFYNHFQDKFELMEWIIREDLLEPIRPLIMADMIQEAMTLLFTNMQMEKTFYARAVRMEGPVTFHQVSCKSVEAFLLEIIREKAASKVYHLKWITEEVIAAYYAQSMCFAAERWVFQGMQVPPKEVAEAYCFMLTHSMADLIND